MLSLDSHTTWTYIDDYIIYQQLYGKIDNSLYQLEVLLNKDPNKLINRIIHGRDDFLKYELFYEGMEWHSESSDPVNNNI